MRNTPFVECFSINLNKLEIRSVHNRRIERLNSVILLPFSISYKNLQMRQMWMCNADVSLYRRWYILVTTRGVKIYRKQWYIYLMMMWSKWVKQYPICRRKNKQGKWIRWQLLHKVYNVEFNLIINELIRRGLHFFPPVSWFLIFAGVLTAASCKQEIVYTW